MNRISFFRQRIPLWKKNPVLFFHEALHFEADEWQRAAGMELAEGARVTIRSGQGVGKTAFEAACLLWFLCCFPFPRIVATAPTRQQLHDVLWSEVAKWQSQSPLLGELLKWTKTYIYMRGFEKRWFAVARTATKPENMQGFHEDNMLFIVDEASGVADPIMEAILGTLSGTNNKLLLCGNPTKTSGVFYNSYTKNRSDYRVHCVSARDVKRTNKENILRLERDYGKDSNVVRVRVDGEPPIAEDDVFIPLSLVEAAVDHEVWDAEAEGKGEYQIGKISFGVDVARYGDDETDIARNVDGFIDIPVNRHGQNLMETVGDIVNLYLNTLEQYPRYRGNIYVAIDDTGLGGGVTDRLQEVKRERKLWRMEIRAVNFAAKVPDKDAAAYYANITTYLWAVVRDRMKAGDLALQDDAESVAQFSVRKYYIASNGKISLESKDDMKKRGIRSPDRADAIALSCFIDRRSSSGPPDLALDKESYWRR